MGDLKRLWAWLKEDPDPRQSTIGWAARQVHRHLSTFTMGTIVIGFVFALVADVLDQPKHPTEIQKILNRVGTFALGLGIAILVLALIALIAAPYLQRNALRKLVDSSNTDPDRREFAALAAAASAVNRKSRYFYARPLRMITEDYVGGASSRAETTEERQHEFNMEFGDELAQVVAEAHRLGIDGDTLDEIAAEADRRARPS